MGKITSVLLGLLSAFIGFIMVLIFAIALIYLVIPINIVLTEWVSAITIHGIIFLFKIFSGMLVVLLIIPIIIYVLGIPQYFNYLDDLHIKPLLALHKYFNLVVSFFILLRIIKLLYEGVRTSQFQLNELVFLSVIFGFTFIIGFFTKVKPKVTPTLKQTILKNETSGLQ